MVFVAVAIYFYFIDLPYAWLVSEDVRTEPRAPSSESGLH